MISACVDDWTLGTDRRTVGGVGGGASAETIVDAWHDTRTVSNGVFWVLGAVHSVGICQSNFRRTRR